MIVLKYLNNSTQVEKYGPVPAGSGDLPASFLQGPVGCGSRNYRSGKMTKKEIHKNLCDGIETKTVMIL